MNTKLIVQNQLLWVAVVSSPNVLKAVGLYFLNTVNVKFGVFNTVLSIRSTADLRYYPTLLFTSLKWKKLSKNTV